MKMAATRIVLDEAVCSGEIPGAVAVAGASGRRCEPLVVGVRKYDAREPMVGGASQGNNGHRNAPGEVVRIQASDHRTTVFGNLTVANPLNPGHTVLYPCDQPKPATSVNNFLGGRNNANAAMVRTDAAGFICASSNEWAHLIWDQVAESDDVTASPAPVRLLDTRR